MADKNVEPKRMCLNCQNSKVTGHGVYCALIPECDIKIDRPTGYSCPEHKYFSE